MVELTIGKLAKAAGVGVETIRFYERKGIIRRPQKRDSGFRTYDAGEAARVRFVKRAQELGFTLREIKELLDIQTKRKITGGQVKEKAQENFRNKTEDFRSPADGGLAPAALKSLRRWCASDSGMPHF